MIETGKVIGQYSILQVKDRNEIDQKRERDMVMVKQRNGMNLRQDRKRTVRQNILAR